MNQQGRPTGEYRSADHEGAPAITLANPADSVAREALLLDTRRWDEWLDMFTEDVRFWLPAWRSESEQTQDPATELSLIYLNGIAALKERVWRVRSGLSRASAVLHRTAHVVGSVLVEPGPSDDTCQVLSAGAVHVYEPATHAEHCFFSRYEHTLRQTPQGWKIAAKRVSLMNDRIPTMLDFYSV